ncbi:hypothetical protein FACS1894186_5330 [Alphaproteobacteria bacterium]|nr:hypothetical protein FACS1894186_5330 [Alphaproteobacteria bacterium]
MSRNRLLMAAAAAAVFGCGALAATVAPPAEIAAIGRFADSDYAFMEAVRKWALAPDRGGMSAELRLVAWSSSCLSIKDAAGSEVARAVYITHDGRFEFFPPTLRRDDDRQPSVLMVPDDRRERILEASLVSHNEDGPAGRPLPTHPTDPALLREVMRAMQGGMAGYAAKMKSIDMPFILPGGLASHASPLAFLDDYMARGEASHLWLRFCDTPDGRQLLVLSTASGGEAAVIVYSASARSAFIMQGDMCDDGSQQADAGRPPHTVGEASEDLANLRRFRFIRAAAAENEQYDAMQQLRHGGSARPR